MAAIGALVVLIGMALTVLALGVAVTVMPFVALGSIAGFVAFCWFVKWRCDVAAEEYQTAMRSEFESVPTALDEPVTLDSLHSEEEEWF